MPQFLIESIKDISKFYDVPFIEVNNVTGKMIFEATPIAKKAHGIKSGVYTPTFEEVMEYSESLKGFLTRYPQIKDHINSMDTEVKDLREKSSVVNGYRYEIQALTKEEMRILKENTRLMTEVGSEATNLEQEKQDLMYGLTQILE